MVVHSRPAACAPLVFNKTNKQSEVAATTAGDPMRRGFAPWADPSVRPLVRFEAVTKRFGGVTAVDRLSLDIYAGELFALLGPPSCGKTTLLRMLAGVERPPEGAARPDAHVIHPAPPCPRALN